MRALRGECSSIAALAREARARAPRVAPVRLQLARAYAADDEPERRIRAELAEAFRLAPDPIMETAFDALLAAHVGDHARALERALATEAAGREADVPSVILAGVALRVGALEELSRSEQAAEVARDYVMRSTSTLSSVTLSGLHTLRDVEVLRAARRVLDAPAFEREHARWAEALTGNATLGPIDRWAMRDAAFARTPEEAVASLARAPAALPRAGELGTLVYAGEALELTERWDEAAERLAPIANGCLRLSHLYASARALLALGRVRLAQGPVDEACDALAGLDRRWPNGSSATRDAARRLRAERCP